MAIRVQEHIPLRDLTTLKVGGTARYFVVASSATELQDAVSFAKEERLPAVILGGGSNVLLSDGELNAVVVKNEIRAIEWRSYSPFPKGSTPILIGGRDLNPPSPTFQKKWGTPPLEKEELGGKVLVIAGAGESWDALVAEAVKRRLWGIENLSGIPGTVGAAPIQNIGAYGTELKDVLEWVETFDTKTGKVRKISNHECCFVYRDSIFKKPEGSSLIVTRVALRLSRNGKPNLAYKDLKERFKIQDSGFKREELTLADIRQAVLEIRAKKFPDLRTHGTAGSFFKNPIISQKQFDALKKKFHDLPGFPMDADKRGYKETQINADNPLKIKDKGLRIKVSLAWILEHICGLKGYRKGNVALFERQPIVLVHNGLASAEEIESFAREIIAEVKKRTGIDIEWEVQKIR